MVVGKAKNQLIIITLKYHFIFHSIVSINSGWARLE